MTRNGRTSGSRLKRPVVPTDPVERTGAIRRPPKARRRTVVSGAASTPSRCDGPPDRRAVGLVAADGGWPWARQAGTPAATHETSAKPDDRRIEAATPARSPAAQIVTIGWSRGSSSSRSGSEPAAMWMLPGHVARLVLVRLADVDDERRLGGVERSRRAASSSTFSRPLDSSGPPPSAHVPKPPRRCPRIAPSAPIRSAWRIASSQSSGRWRTRTSGRDGSTTQPSHVPNDGPSGTDCEPTRVGDRVICRRPEVEEQGTGRDLAPGLLEAEWPRLRDAPAEERGPGLVRRAHPGEVPRDGRLATEQALRRTSRRRRSRTSGLWRRS